jgi:hypothetical protein
MNAVANTASAMFLNATLPTATGGKPGTWTAYSSAGAMYVRVNSVAYSGANPGASEETQLANGNGYVTNGAPLGASSAASLVSNTETVTLPASAVSWTNGSGGWTIASLDITDNAQAWTWFGNWNGQPITIAAGNTFQAAANAVSVTDA